MKRSLALTSVIVLLLPALAAAWPPARPLAGPTAVTAAPVISSPGQGQELTTLGPTLQWSNPAGATQYHLQVIPFNSDGPGVDLHVGAPDQSFTIPAPPDWYGLLPDMTYQWRVRASDATTFVELQDPSWGPWASGSFRTPKADSSTITAGLPTSGSNVDTLNPLLAWNNTRRDVFYYEVQLSKDATFSTDPATATAMVYWELRHGGVTKPINSYQVPAAFPLETSTTYYWRVRPRIQGDGTPVPWSTTFSFRTSATAKPGVQEPVETNPAISGSRIVFVSDREGLPQIYSVRPDGTGLVNLSKSSSGGNEEPAVSSTGKIAFRSSRDADDEIYVMNADGSGQTRVTTSTGLDCCPTWSPDSTKIAFRGRHSGGQQQIYVVNANGTGQTQLTVFNAAHYDQSFSPDGKKIAYGYRTATDNEIFVANADGSGEINVTNSPGPDYGQVWSPDGKKFAFLTAREGNEKGVQLYVMNVDGSSPKNLSNTIGNHTTPVWSPDGSKIAFVRFLSKDDSEVFVMNADGSGQRNLSNHTAIDEFPTWSPDGTQVAFVTNRNGNKDIYIAKVDGTGLTRLTDSTADDRAPAWTDK